MTAIVNDELTRPATELTAKPQGKWTYADYKRIPEDGRRYEIIKGVLYVSPAPNRWHQNASVNFTMLLGKHVKGKLGYVFAAPFDVQLFENNDEFVVQPDFMVVLTEHADRITAGCIIGAPDIIVEIASPSTANYDRTTKLESYRTAGVTEYWIANPVAQTVEVLLLVEGVYQSQGTFSGAARLVSQVLPNFRVKVAKFFE
jgi:Uma2 family endonuclease